MGKTARLWIGGVDVLVSASRGQTLSQNAFRSNGIDPTRYKLVAVKSSNHFRAGFRDIAAEIITADAPGLTVRNYCPMHALATIFSISPPSTTNGLDKPRSCNNLAMMV